uniref:Ileal sodium/bile acid cotransporter n=1 Tax=Photinus pyralis TaxID=7054 RepID=A0A1Y1NJA7_PHOPY
MTDKWAKLYLMISEHQSIVSVSCLQMACIEIINSFRNKMLSPVVIFTILLICSCMINAQKFTVKTQNEEETIIMDTITYSNFTVEGNFSLNPSPLYLFIHSKDNKLAEPQNAFIVLKNEATTNGIWKSKGSFGVSGVFLGKTTVLLNLQNSNSEILASGEMAVKVVRPKRVIDTVFTSTVATLVSIIYINFGCALNWKEVYSSVKKPIGPAIGFVGQFVFMPLISFGLGRLVFPNDPQMQLGLFFTGISPGGGASNVWVAILNGNIHQSITMTTINTFCAFGMMPLWLFTLGAIIFEEAKLEVPYRQISTYAVALVVPLLIGYLLQRFCKRVSNFFVRILKAFSGLLILFIVIFAIVSNLYLFKIFSWQIIVGGMGLPWLGYILAYVLAKLFKQSKELCLTIAVETGVQNTGIAIFLLRFALPQPEADITTVVPVYVAMMTPVPLMCLVLYQRITARKTWFNTAREYTVL